MFDPLQPPEDRRDMMPRWCWWLIIAILALLIYAQLYQGLDVFSYKVDDLIV